MIWIVIGLLFLLFCVMDWVKIGYGILYLMFGFCYLLELAEKWWKGTK